MSLRPRVLIVEDEEPIRRGLVDLLVFHGMDPVAVATGDEGLRRALDEPWELVVLDVMLPGVDGFTICERVRDARSGQAILMLTAKGREEDVLRGFSAGCDDYVAKPFSVAQLTARVKALVRRAGAVPERVLVLGPVEVDEDALEARSDAGTVQLSIRDVEVLRFLASRKPAVVRRAELLSEVWGYVKVDRVETRAVDMHLVKLRRKLAEVCDQELIETVRGAGYRLVT